MKHAGFAFAAACVLSGGSALLLAQANRPNLVFVLTDDQGEESIEGDFWSNPLQNEAPSSYRFYTNNFKNYARQGVSFTNVRVNPNCSPTRASLMTGRSALRTGVNGVVGWTGTSTPTGTDAYKLMLQNHERTIAEVLRELDENGYWTVLIDKWHCGFGVDQMPEAQGFDYFEWWRDWYPLDDPDQVGDEHIVRMKNFALDGVASRPDPNQPWALFFHSIMPHRLDRDSGGSLWWELDPSLTPSTASFGDAEQDRYIQAVEAIDTAVHQMLRDLGVVDASGNYRDESDTVVFFVSDNGTDPCVSWYNRDNLDPCSPNNNHAKNSLFDGGIRVPAFVFGEGIPEPWKGTEDDRLITAADFFETICDIVEASPAERGNPLGDFPRDSVSFADSIGWASPGSIEPREYTLSSIGNVRNNAQVWQVALTDGEYKLICRSGGPGLTPMYPAPNCTNPTYCVADEFYDLKADPEERFNLLDRFTGQMTQKQTTRYFEMRDAIVDYWPSAVAEALDPADLPWYSIESENAPWALVMYVDYGQPASAAYDEFYNIEIDPERSNNLLTSPLAPDAQTAYDAMRIELLESFEMGFESPDVRVVDIPASRFLVLDNDPEVPIALTVGHKVANGVSTSEFRGYIRFDSLVTSLPEGFGIEDVVDAQIIIGFKEDSTAANETDTGVVRIHPVTTNWDAPRYRNLWNGFNTSVDLGAFDPPPHIIWETTESDPVLGRVRTLPLPPQTPISFGHRTDLLNLVRDWFYGVTPNNGVAVIVDGLPGLPGDQRVHFLRYAGLRLTLDRRD